MSWFRRTARWVGLRALKIAGIPPRDPQSAAIFGYVDTVAGVPVTEYTALNTSAFWAGIRFISESAAQLPLRMYRKRKSGGKDEITDRPEPYLINVEASSEMTGQILRETQQGHALSWGNGYSYIERDGAGRVTALRLLTPNRVIPDRDKQGKLFYLYADDTGVKEVFDPSEVLHIPGFSFNGLTGYSVVQIARESLALSLAAEKYGAAAFGNGTSPIGTLTTPNRLTKEAYENMRQSWSLIHQGPDKAHRIAILEQGTEFKPLMMSLEDLQCLSIRQFQITEVARWLNMPPHLLRDLTRATYSNIEQQSLEFVIYTLRPWLQRWNLEFLRKLIPEKERQSIFFEHDTTVLERGDLLNRYKAHAMARQWGWESADDVREAEGWNPLPGEQGNEYLVPVNMRPADEPYQPTGQGSTPATPTDTVSDREGD